VRCYWELFGEHVRNLETLCFDPLPAPQTKNTCIKSPLSKWKMKIGQSISTPNTTLSPQPHLQENKGGPFTPWLLIGCMENSTPKFGSHFLGPGPIALPKNTLPTVQCTSGVCSFSLALQSCKRPSGWGIPKRTGPPHPPRLLPYTKPILEKELLPFLSREMWGESTKHWYSWISPTQKGIHCNDQKKHVGNFPIEWGFRCVAQCIPFFEMPMMFLYKHTNTHKPTR
jgi:hypothetical protein